MLVTFLDGSRREVALAPGAHLAGAHLSGAHLRSADLRSADLSGAARGVATGFKKAKELPLP